MRNKRSLAGFLANSKALDDVIGGTYVKPTRCTLNDIDEIHDKSKKKRPGINRSLLYGSGERIRTSDLWVMSLKGGRENPCGGRVSANH